jgi:hypothetical protein
MDEFILLTNQNADQQLPSRLVLIGRQHIVEVRPEKSPIGEGATLTLCNGRTIGVVESFDEVVQMLYGLQPELASR